MKQCWHVPGRSVVKQGPGSGGGKGRGKPKRGKVKLSAADRLKAKARSGHLSAREKSRLARAAKQEARQAAAPKKPAPQPKKPPRKKRPPPPPSPAPRLSEVDHAEMLAGQSIPSWSSTAPAELSGLLDRMAAEIRAEQAAGCPVVSIDRILPERGQTSDRRNETDIRTFPPAQKVLQLVPDRRANVETDRAARRFVSVLRPYLSLIDPDPVMQERLVGGRRLLSGSLPRHLAYGEPRLFADQRLADTDQHRSVLFCVLIDTSASMQADDRLPRAQRLASLLAQCLSDCLHIETALVAYNQNVYRCGDHEGHALSALAPAGKTNEAAALDYLRAHHLGVPRRRKIVLVLSDGLPTDCSVESVVRLVRTLEKDQGARLLYVALSGSDHPAYRNRVDFPSDLEAARLRMLGRAVAALLA
jgi:hypothetical protein